MAKQQTNDEDLFANLSMADFEESIIVDDAKPENEVREEVEVEDVAPDDNAGGGDPGSPKKGDKPVPKKPQDLITVDTGDDDEEEEKPEQRKETKKEGGSTSKEETESPVYLHAAALQENGVLPNFNLEDLKGLDAEKAILKINEHIQSQINASITDAVTEYKETLGEKAKAFVESLEKGIPFESLAENYSLEQEYGSINTKNLEDNEELQEKIYADYLSLKGFSDNKIKNLVSVAKEKETLLEEASDGLKEIKSAIEYERKELVKQQEAEAEERRRQVEKTRETVKSFVTEQKEIIPGINVTEEEKKDIIKMMTVPVNFVAKDGRKIPMSAAMAERAKNPVLFEMRLAYFVKNGFFDEKITKGAFDVFTKKVETNTTKKLAQVLDGEKRTKGRSVPDVSREKEKEKQENDFIFPQDLMST